jgi:hypothetical protein
MKNYFKFNGNNNLFKHYRLSMVAKKANNTIKRRGWTLIIESVNID